MAVWGTESETSSCFWWGSPLEAKKTKQTKPTACESIPKLSGEYIMQQQSLYVTEERRIDNSFKQYSTRFQDYYNCTHWTESTQHFHSSQHLSHNPAKILEAVVLCAWTTIARGRNHKITTTSLLPEGTLVPLPLVFYSLTLCSAKTNATV